MSLHEFSLNQSFFREKAWYCTSVPVRKLPLADMLFLILLLVGGKTVTSISILRLNGKQLCLFPLLFGLIQYCHWSELCYWSFYWLEYSLFLLLELYMGDHCSIQAENNHLCIVNSVAIGLNFCYLSFYWLVCPVLLLLELYMGDHSSSKAEKIIFP